MKQIKLFSILMMLVLCCGTVFAQGITITGTITDCLLYTSDAADE